MNQIPHSGPLFSRQDPDAVSMAIDEFERFGPLIAKYRLPCQRCPVLAGPLPSAYCLFVAECEKLRGFPVRRSARSASRRPANCPIARWPNHASQPPASSSTSHRRRSLCRKVGGRTLQTASPRLVWLPVASRSPRNQPAWRPFVADRTVCQADRIEATRAPIALLWTALHRAYYCICRTTLLSTRADASQLNAAARAIPRSRRLLARSGSHKICSMARTSDSGS